MFDDSALSDSEDNEKNEANLQYYWSDGLSERVLTYFFILFKKKFVSYIGSFIGCIYFTFVCLNKASSIVWKPLK